MHNKMIAVAALALMLAVCAGCNPYSTLPANRIKPEPPAPAAGDSPVYSWHAETPVLRTFWDAQELKITCSGYFPASWRQAGDERWRVECVNKQGTKIPYLGVMRRYKNNIGLEEREVLPAFDINKIDDGLYIIMESGIKTSAPAAADAAPAIVEIRPALLLVEIRKHKFWPFQVSIPLVPDKPSALTPEPETVKQSSKPQGTAMP